MAKAFDPVVVTQALRAGANLPELFRALKISHLRLTTAVDNALELFDSDPVLAKSYLEVAAEERQVLDVIEEITHDWARREQG